MFVLNDGWTLILKMVENKVFLMKLNHRHHLSQGGEYVYGAQSWKERRLLGEFVFIPIERQTLIVKNGRKWGSSYEIEASISFIPTSIMCLWCPIIEKKEIITWICTYPIDKQNLILKNGRKWSFSYETKASINLSQ